MSGDLSPPPDIIHLLQFNLPEDTSSTLQQALMKITATLSIQPEQMKIARALSSHQLTCYLKGLPAGDEQLDVMHNRLVDALRPADAAGMELGRLRIVARHKGAAYGEKAGYHYVVRTDVESGGEQELQRWYDEEHMPMLAAVPGTARACRLISLDALPKFYACYDLLAPEVLESAAWLQVRATPWSERVRPMFENTQRIMSRLVSGIPAC
jgi:hypothetical protein